jgi:rubrerythrin
MKTKEIKCEQCGETSEVKIGRTFLGFNKAVCPKCNHQNIYPLGNGYRTFYIILISLGVLMFIVTISTGVTFTPGILLIAAIIAIFKDSSLRKKIKKVELDKQVAVAPAEPTKTQKGFKSYCHQCGTGLKDSIQFCPSCGAKQN